MRVVPFNDEDKAALPDGAEVIVMGPPPGWSGSECGTTEVVRLRAPMAATGRVVTSHTTKWMPTVDELAQLNAGGAVFLETIGEGMPPVWCGTNPWVAASSEGAAT